MLTLYSGTDVMITRSPPHRTVQHYASQSQCTLYRTPPLLGKNPLLTIACKNKPIFAGPIPLHSTTSDIICKH